MKAGLPAAFANSAARRDPTTGEISGGFPCGPLDIELFNELVSRSTQAGIEIANVIDAAGIVPDEGDLEQLKKALAVLHAPASPTWWRLSAPAVTLVDDVDTQIGSFGNNLSRLSGSTVNASTGAVTISAADAGVYVITAAYNTVNQAQEEAIRIVVNGTDYAVAAGCSPTADNSFLDQSVSTVVSLAAGDVVTTRYRQKNAGGATRALAALERDHFSGVRIGN